MIQRADEIPTNVDAEQAAIGCLFLRPETLDHVRSIVAPADFFDDGLRKCYETITDMADAGRPINDFVAVQEQLRASGAFQMIGGASALANLFVCVPHAANATYYAKQVAHCSALRQQIILAAELHKRASDPGNDPAEIRQWIEARFAAFGSPTDNRARSVGDIARESVEAITADCRESRKPGVMTGFFEYDRTFGALMRGELIILAARPSIGKTALGLQIAENAAMRGHRSLVVSLEMRDRELVDRMLSKITGIDGRKIRARSLDGGQLTQLRAAANDLDGVPLVVWAPHAATVAQIRAIAKLEAARGGLGCVVVDYIGLVKPTDKFRPRHEQVADVSAMLKGLAKELDLPVLALCQLNREAESQVPTLAMLRESGAIEQDADVVMFLHKEERSDRQASWIVAKSRNGETGAVTLNWEPSTTRFSCPNEPKTFGEFNEYNNG